VSLALASYHTAHSVEEHGDTRGCRVRARGCASWRNLENRE
jgi:hypothetical protein